MFKKAQHYLVNPIKKISYLPQKMVDDTLLLAGDNALSERTMLNPPRITCCATGDIDNWKPYMQNTLVDENEQIALQIWKYDPMVLARKGCVDVLSLAICYADDGDARVDESMPSICPMMPF